MVWLDSAVPRQRLLHCVGFDCWPALLIGTPAVSLYWPHSDEWGGCVFLAGLQSRSWAPVEVMASRGQCLLNALCFHHQESVFLFRCESKVRRSVLYHIGSRCPFDTLPPASLFLLYFHSNYKGGLQSFCVHSSWTAPAPMVAQTAFALKSWNIHEVPDSAIPRVPCMWKQTSSLSHQTSKRDRKQPIL